MADGYLLGIDIGTSRIKAALFDKQGKMVALSWRDATLNGEGAISEIDMDELWQDVAATISQVLKKTKENITVAGVGVSAQGEGLWLIDQGGNPVQKAILWNDGRANSLVNRLDETAEFDLKIRALTGSSLFAGATNILLKWMKENNSDMLGRADKLLFCKDWIRYKLTGIIATDLTDASTSLLDMEKGKITNELFQLLDIEDQLSLVPDFINAAEKSGNITKEAAELTGLKAGIAVATGAFDVVATAIGCGAIEAGDACTILGTSGCNIVVNDGFHRVAHGRSGTEFHALAGKTININATMAATPNLNWIYNLFHKDKSFLEVEKKLEDITAGCDGLIYHPYISQSGERAPFYSPGARAQFSGLNELTTPLMMTRAVYEGIALSVRDCLEGQKPKRLFLAGGGSRSIFWAQIIANCTNLPIFISDETELCARGSALMAAVAAGTYSNLEQALKNVSKPRLIEPDARQVIIYNDIYKKYKKITEAMLPIWNI